MIKEELKFEFEHWNKEGRFVAGVTNKAGLGLPYWGCIGPILVLSFTDSLRVRVHVEGFRTVPIEIGALVRAAAPFCTLSVSLYLCRLWYLHTQFMALLKESSKYQSWSMQMAHESWLGHQQTVMLFVDVLTTKNDGMEDIHLFKTNKGHMIM